jgi:hypothetical protein
MSHDAASLDALLDSLNDLVRRPPGTVSGVRQKYRALAALAAAAPGTLVDAAAVYGRILADIEALEEASANQLLTYDEAARESGLSPRQLARLAEAGKVDYVGSNRGRRFRRGSLPKRGSKPPPPPPPPVAPSSTAPYDPHADARRTARQLGLSRRGGN